MPVPKILWVSSVHEVSRPTTQVRLFGFLERKLDSRQSDQQDVESMEEEDEEEEPEGSVVALTVRLKGKADLIKIGNSIGQMAELHFRRKEDHHQTTAQTCRTDWTLARTHSDKTSSCCQFYTEKTLVSDWLAGLK